MRISFHGMVGFSVRVHRIPAFAARCLARPSGGVL